MKRISAHILPCLAALLLLSAGFTNVAANANTPPATAKKASQLPLAVDVDGRKRNLHPVGQVSVVMYTNGDLEEQSRNLSTVLDPLRGRKDFHLTRVVDLRGEVAPIARRLVEKQIRKELDKEAVRLKPYYNKNDNPVNPRYDMPTIADFNGGVLDKLGWDSHYTDIRIVVYNKRGEEARRFDKIADPVDVNSYLKTLL